MRKYSEDHEIVVSVDENGREKRTAVYRGDFFRVTFSNGDITGYRKRAFTLIALMIFFHFGAGFINNPGMYQFYIALPYVIAFFPLLYLAMGVFHLPKETREYRRDEVGLSFNRIISTSKSYGVIIGIGILGTIIYLLFFASISSVLLELLYLLFQLLTFAMVFLLFSLHRQVQIQNLTTNDDQGH